MKLLSDEMSFEIQELKSDLLISRKIKLGILRLDKIHPVISGNKLFKLHYFIEQTLLSEHKMMLTFGGAYSNHLAATALCCKLSGLKSIGIIRGERPLQLSHTLAQCEMDGMQLKFISREKYRNVQLKSFKEDLRHQFGEYTFVPEGGYHPLGAKGASIIMEKIKPLNPTHICTAVGTATTLAGLLLASDLHHEVIGIPVLKNLNDIQQRISFLCGRQKIHEPVIFNDYDFGGYAKKTPALIDFMNDLYSQHNLPTDFVYTARMMYAVMDKISAGFFPEGSYIICLHTGGLQGNSSLPAGTLIF